MVKHPLIRAVGFTGSLTGGRALFDLCAQRPEPIPFFGELGSINPMFILPAAAATRGAEIGAGWAGSLTMGVGQFCTNPGVAVVLKDHAEAMAKAAVECLKDTAPQPMLTDGIAAAYRSGQSALAAEPSVTELLASVSDGRTATPFLYQVSAQDWLGNETLGHKVFGPLGLLVVAENMGQMREVSMSLQGQLTCTLHMDPGDAEIAQMLMPVLERKAGRVLVNGFPTGVEVSDTMVHGGPYPASTNFGATSVGTLAIRRFLRPVCFQNVPVGMLPEQF